VMRPSRPARAGIGPSRDSAAHRRALAEEERKRGRWLRDYVLSEFLDRSPDKFTFDVDERGRPEFRGVPNTRAAIDVSLTHTAGAVAVAVVEEARVGLDMERQRPVARERLRQVFSDEEWATIAASADPDTAVLRLWTLKEALLKAIGVGIRWPLRAVLDGAVERAGVISVCPPVALDPERRSWSLFRLEPLPGYVGACAVSETTSGGSPPIVHIVGPTMAG
jgi:4'-phosphopantetheinyl transferase